MSLTADFLNRGSKKDSKTGKKRKRVVDCKEEEMIVTAPPKKKRKIESVSKKKKKKSEEVIDVKRVHGMLSRNDNDEIRAALHVLKGEKLEYEHINDINFPIGDLVFKLRASDDELIHTYSSELVSEWIKKALYKPKMKKKVTEAEVKKMFSPTGDSMRDFVILTISTLLINLLPDHLVGKYTPQQCVERAKEIESEIHRSTNGNKMQYRRKFMSINPHMKDLDNNEFRSKLLTKKITPIELMKMKPQEMASKLKTRERERLKREKNHLKMEFKKDDIKDGMYQCRKCGSKKCSVYEMQTRSGDEPMTQFISCLKCGKRWRR